MHTFALRIFACVFVLLIVDAVQAATVKNVRVWRGPDYTRVVFDLDAPVKHNLTLADNPDRIILDVPASTLKSSLNNLALAGTPIEVARSSVVNKTDLQLVLDLNKRVTAKSFTLKKEGKNDDRLVIDLFDATNDVATTAQNKSASSTPVATVA